jgi:putative ABC transport system permease protein
MGRTRSFLDFSLASGLRLGLTGTALRVGIGTAGLCLLALVLPTISVARNTVFTYRQQRARALRAPWWQRAWLDVLLLLPALYGDRLLRQQGSLVVPIVGDQLLADQANDPLLFLVPALYALVATLLLLRLLPWLMSGLAWVAARVGGTGFLLASRTLARSPGVYAVPLTLLTLTLSLSVFTASLARTLDRDLHDRIRYRIGADMVLDGDQDPLQAAVSGEALAQSAQPSPLDGPRWVFRPVSAHLELPGVQAATRVGSYPAVTYLSGSAQAGTFVGVDRVDFAQVAFWRRDFAEASLGELMNALAASSDGVLLPRDFAAHHGLAPGDTFRASVDVYDVQTERELTVVGLFDLFPTWYPQVDIGRGTLRDRTLLVGNLDALFMHAGGQVPYDVWLRTTPDADWPAIAAEAYARHLRVMRWQAPSPTILAEQRRPARQGLFGQLSVGFLAAALLTVLGFLLYAFFSFRRRAVELGVLRAIGLSLGQLTAALGWELAFLIGAGGLAGTGLGVWVSRRFVPYMQIGVGPEARIPPFSVEIAWPTIGRIYLLFVLLFVIALLGLTALLSRTRIFQAIKLGETI